MSEPEVQDEPVVQIVDELVEDFPPDARFDLRVKWFDRTTNGYNPTEIGNGEHLNLTVDELIRRLLRLDSLAVNVVEAVGSAEVTFRITRTP